MGFSAWCKTIRGYSHELAGTICQDHSAVKIGSYYSMALVADGHGGEQYIRSDQGSRIAVESAIKVIEQALSDRKQFEELYAQRPDDLIDRLEQNIIATWNDSVAEYDRDHPLTTAEKQILDRLKAAGRTMRASDSAFGPIEYQRYGTTLIIGILCDDFSFGIQIGDGNLVTVADDDDCTTCMPIPMDEHCHDNITTSICDEKAFRYMHHWFVPVGKPQPMAITVSSDGLRNTFLGDDSFMRYCRIVVSQMDNVAENEAAIVANLTKRSLTGPQDDTSLAIIWRNETDFSELNSIRTATCREMQSKASAATASATDECQSVARADYSRHKGRKLMASRRGRQKLRGRNRR